MISEINSLVDEQKIRMVVVDVWIGLLMISWKDCFKTQLETLIENADNLNI